MISLILENILIVLFSSFILTKKKNDLWLFAPVESLIINSLIFTILMSLNYWSTGLHLLIYIFVVVYVYFKTGEKDISKFKIILIRFISIATLWGLIENFIEKFHAIHLEGLVYTSFIEGALHNTIHQRSIFLDISPLAKFPSYFSGWSGFPLSSLYIVVTTLAIIQINLESKAKLSVKTISFLAILTNFRFLEDMLDLRTHILLGLLLYIGIKYENTDRSYNNNLIILAGIAICRPESWIFLIYILCLIIPKEGNWKKVLLFFPYSLFVLQHYQGENILHISIILSPIIFLLVNFFCTSEIGKKNSSLIRKGIVATPLFVMFAFLLSRLTETLAILSVINIQLFHPSIRGFGFVTVGFLVILLQDGISEEKILNQFNLLVFFSYILLGVLQVISYQNISPVMLTDPNYFQEVNVVGRTFLYYVGEPYNPFDLSTYRTLSTFIVLVYLSIIGDDKLLEKEEV